MGKKRKITIEELIEELEVQVWCIGCSGFRIIEELSVRREFELEDLHIDLEDEYILFYDKDDKLFSSVLSMVFKEALIAIYHQRNDNGIMHGDMEFSTGHVYIDSIAA